MICKKENNSGPLNFEISPTVTPYSFSFLIENMIDNTVTSVGRKIRIKSTAI